MQLSAEAAARLLRLIQLCLEINSEKNLNALIDLLITKVPLVLGAERSTLLLHDPARGELWSRIGTGLNRDDAIRMSDTIGLAGHCFQSGAVLNVGDVHADPRFYPEIDRRTGFRTINSLSLPVRDVAGRTIGVLQVMNKPTGFSSEDEQLCEFLAAQAGIAVENSRTFERLRHEHERLTEENRQLRSELKSRHDFPELVGTGAALTAVLERVRQAAPTSATVLLTGETGTGKELIAKLIHHHSPRADRPLVTINCSAIPGPLLESELFGYERGAFTGAVAPKRGLFEAADGGTLFLDEIGDLPLELQHKLLRVLQEGEIRRLGSTETQHVDVRIVAATNRDLLSMVQAGAYREDLYYRLHVVPIELPPLRERREDIAMLATHFVQRFSRRHGKQAPDLDAAALDCLLRYPFPGNIRELENAMERAVVLARGPLVTAADLPPEMQQRPALPPLDTIPATNVDLKRAKRGAEEAARRRVERQFVTALLHSTAGNVTRAAAQAGINRSVLQQMLARHGVKAIDFRRGTDGDDRGP